MFKTGSTATIAFVLLLCGCAAEPQWPTAPERTIGSAAAPTAVMWRPDGPDGRVYLQSCRDGVKRGLYLQDESSESFHLLADLDELDPASIRRVFIMLDGVGYDVFRELYDEGHFRLFHRPTRMVAPFPSLTDISFDNMFGVSGAGCYESVVFNRGRNALYSGTGLYLSGRNELWATRLDYRQTRWVDGVSYTLPDYATRREFASMFATAERVLQEEPTKRDVLLYCLSTDGASHSVGRERLRELLVVLDRNIERLMYDHEGRIGVVLLSDHGNNLVPQCRRLDLDAVMAAAGLTAVFDRGFKRPGDVVVPRYGLISFLRAFCQSDADRAALIDALAATEGVEHVMWMDGGCAMVARGDTRAAIGYRTAADDEGRIEEYFSYMLTGGDPLELAHLLAALPGRSFDGDEAAYYSAAELLEATIDHDWPDALWRIWHGLTDQVAVAPDVAASLAPGWYYGSPGLDWFADLNGTHGGLPRVESTTLFTTTMFAGPAIMRTTDVIDVINRHFPWIPPTADPSTFGLHEYLGDE